MKLFWTSVGEVYSRDCRDRLAVVFSRLNWKHVSRKLPAFEALAVGALIREFKIPAVRIAVSNEPAPFGLYGIEGRYKNGTARISFLDDGTHLTPIASWLVERSAP